MAKTTTETEFDKKWIHKAKRMNPKKLDELFHGEHKNVFKKTDCLSCGNCCKTTSPIFRDVDIQRLAKHLRLTEQKLIATYLHKDDEEDYVLNSSPCAFLGTDNYCSVYEFRPLACREYPHTDRKNMFQILDLTQKNRFICPAVNSIIENITLNKEFITK